MGMMVGTFSLLPLLHPVLLLLFLVILHHRVVDVTHAFRPHQSSRSIAGGSARADHRRPSSCCHNRWHPHRHCPASPSPSRRSGNTDDRVGTIVSLGASGGDLSYLAGGTTGVVQPPPLPAPPPIAMTMPPPPRRGFAFDFGIASEQAEPIHDDDAGGGRPARMPVLRPPPPRRAD